MQTPHFHATLRWLIGAYIVLLALALLHPLDQLRWVPQMPWAFVFDKLPWRWVTRRDVLVNIIAFIPLGVLAAWCIASSGKFANVRLRYGVMIGLGLLLAFSFEAAQTYNPQRVPSSLDALLNTLGLCLGALLGAAVYAPLIKPARNHAWNFFHPMPPWFWFLLIAWLFLQIHPTEMAFVPSRLDAVLLPWFNISLPLSLNISQAQEWETLTTMLSSLSLCAWLAICGLALRRKELDFVRRLSVLLLLLVLALLFKAASFAVQFDNTAQMIGFGHGLLSILLWTIPSAVLLALLPLSVLRVAAILLLALLLALVQIAPPNPYLMVSESLWQKPFLQHLWSISLAASALWPIIGLLAASAKPIQYKRS